MVSITKHKWSNNGAEKEAWMCRYIDADGVRRGRSFTQKKEADAFKRQVEAER